MNETILIGQGPYGNSWTLIRDLEDGCYISSNNVSYLVHGALLSTDLRISKDSDTGILLMDLLRKNSSDKVVMNCLDKIVLSKLSAPNVRAGMKAAYLAGVEQGRQLQAATIRQALML